MYTDVSLRRKNGSAPDSDVSYLGHLLAKARVGDREEKAEAGRHLKYKTRIRARSMREARRDGRQEKEEGREREKEGKSPTDVEFPGRFSAASPSSYGAHKHFLSRGTLHFFLPHPRVFSASGHLYRGGGQRGGEAE